MNTPPEGTQKEQRYLRIYATIDSIPKGRVSTYGRIAEEAGIPRGARQVAAALRNLPRGRDIPWHRVISSSGKVSIPSEAGAKRQTALLQAEGIPFRASGRVNLKVYAWPE